MKTPIQLRAENIIDPALEAHYAFLSTFSAITTRLHTHNFYELFFIRSGKVEHLVNGDIQHLDAGALVFIRPPDAHCYRQAGQHDCQLINLAVPTYLIDGLLRYMGDDFDSQLLLESPLPKAAYLDENSRLLLWEQFIHWNTMQLSAPAQARLELRLLLASLFTRYFATSTPEPTLTGLAWLDMLCQTMRQPEHFAAGVERMQTLAGCSAEHLARTCRRYLQMTPTAFVNGLRLDYAANHLAHTDTTIADVAFEAGFENLSHFYHLFQKRFHQSPQHYRRSRRKLVVP
ncbi:MAG: helix-turn-helix domain-containing protein [Anaerolineaceae bacterium]|nr:helix-turn-helix domain-containing protein [Anaerolineaceae bacterium]